MSDGESRYYDGDDGDNPLGNLGQAAWAHNSQRVLTSAYGKKVLAEFIAALDALPEPRLAHGDLVALVRDEDDKVVEWQACAIGAFCIYKGLGTPEEVSHMAYEDDLWLTAEVGARAGMRHTMAWNIAYRNDETYADYTPDARWIAMRQWAVDALAGKTEAIRS